MAEISRDIVAEKSEENHDKISETTFDQNENLSEVKSHDSSYHTENTEPRLVRLKRKNQSFGLKLRGQASEGGPRWLINGKIYKNLHTVSAVGAESSAEECGVKVGDKILSINGIDVEGAQHEQLRSLMSGSGDDVDVLLVTPSEAKMLDIPAAMVIHRSDGSTTSIDKSTLLRNDTIDEIPEKEHEKEADEESVLKVQVHAKSDEQEEDASERDDDENAEVDDKAETIDAEKEVGSENADDASSGGLIDSGKQLEESAEANVVSGDDQDSKNAEEHSCQSQGFVEDSNEQKALEDGVAEHASETDQTSSVHENSEISNDERKETEENMESNNDVETKEELESTVLEEEARESVESLEKRDDIDQSSSDGTCLCGQQSKTQGRRLKSKEKERDMLIRQMRMISASMKRLKVSPFSPDTFNNLSPYFSLGPITEESGHRVRMQEQPRSWRYSNQRPTALGVLDPADALRLENSDLEAQVRIWSSNFAGKPRMTALEANGEAVKLREELSKAYTNLIKKRSLSRRETLHRYLHDDKFIALSKHFIKANARDTVLTYMTH